MTHKKYSIPIEQLRQWLRYDPETGDVVWLVKRCGRVRLGYPVRKPDKYGYYNITLDRLPHRLHNVIWALYYGEWPPAGMEVDHINLCKTDNRITNLRLATKSQQRGNTAKEANTSSQYKGVCWEKSRGLWRSAIMVNGKSIFLGRFLDEYEAHLAYRQAADKYFGEFARYG